MKKQYFELTRLIERLHRRYVDVLKTELNRIGVRDINGVQALLLTNIGDEEISIRDLVERGYYLGSNVSYNIKKLTDLGYLDQERSEHDKRSVNVKLTDKALGVVASMRGLQDYNAEAFVERTEDPDSIDAMCQGLRSLEQTWSDYIHYGMKEKV
ncbi:MAG: MarR family transcriptional regulator [Alphaproteobacteria bacterium]|nr:MarR family transcriptional regulator [Alphaproteobacteria bacterium]MBT7942587.1 MarR family transcriptional regulator [Alphaproteobacteria bacterium]